MNAEPPPASTNSIGMRFVYVVAGEFLMGSPAEAGGGDGSEASDERPSHRVRISQAFYVAQFETTQAEYRAVMNENPSWFCATGGGRGEVAALDTSRYPVEMASWDEATDFCRRLSELPAERQARRSYRLPTEAEWEYAARAGTATRYCFGEELTPSQACILAPDGAAAPRTRPVGSYAPNGFGLYDVHGNVWEWCADRYGADYYQSSPMLDPPGPDMGTGRVVRGGDYRFPSAMARSANRDFTRASRRDQGNGFRVVLVVEH
ncbi:MAG: formylglycine-generating enzyme family protein [Planctomycetia bacterium]|nr:formylglycine-generating enzyme family protein [Planctomycetia bacterium]